MAYVINGPVDLGDISTNTTIYGNIFLANTTTTNGDIVYADSFNELQRVALGTAGQVLTSVGGVPAWADPTGVIDRSFAARFTDAATQFEVIPTSSTGVAEITTLTVVVDTAGAVYNGAGDIAHYFLLDHPSTNYYVYFLRSGDLATDPAVPGRTGISVTFTSGDTAATIGDLTGAAIDAVPNFSATQPTDGSTVVTNSLAGAVTDDDASNMPGGSSAVVGTQGTNDYGGGAVEIV